MQLQFSQNKQIICEIPYDNNSDNDDYHYYQKGHFHPSMKINYFIVEIKDVFELNFIIKFH